jgi:serine/threonine protein kinase
MLTRADYRAVAVDSWRLSVLAQFWSKNFEQHVLELVVRQIPTRHPQTLQFDCQVEARQRSFFLKVFHRTSGWGALKDSLRQTKAMRFWRQGLELAAAGFKAPVTIAVGTERSFGIAKREFVLTEKIDGASLPQFLHDFAAEGTPTWSEKRRGIDRLAKLIRRFHDRGFVHGDLVATNIFLSRDDAEGSEFYFMDNDRTKRFPTWLPQKLWRRNLIQLNRMPLAGISLQDRMRFLHGYLGVASFSDADRRFARWLEARTRQRRKECDGAEPNQNYRQLMRWVAESPGVNGAKSKLNDASMATLLRSHHRKES